MSLEAQYYREAGTIPFTAAAALAAGQVVQLPDGRAGVITGAGALAIGDAGAAHIAGHFVVAKTTSVVLLDGQRLYWVKSTGKVSYAGDFFVGTCVGDAASAATTCTVDLNNDSLAAIDLRDGYWNESSSLGLGVVALPGGGVKLAFDAVAEVARAALMSARTLPIAAGIIFDTELAIFDIGDAAALDISIGLASAGHDTDMDAVAETVLFHLDGSGLSVNCESDDGTTEVAATDSTVDLVDDTFAHLAIDARDLTDVKFYINGVQVLSGTTFDVSAASGPWYAILHMEKTSDDTTADVRARNLRARTSVAG